MKTNKFIIVIAVSLLTITGFLLRTHGLGSNYSFWIDEFSTGQFASAILKTGSPKTVSGVMEARNLLNQYLVAGAMRVFGVNEFSARFPSVIWGTLLIPMVYFVFSRIFSWRIGVMTAILTTFSFLEIAWSRQARGYAMLQVFSLSSFYLFWNYFSKSKLSAKNGLYIILGLVFLALSLYAHLLSITLVTTAVFFIIYQRRLILRSKNSLLIFVLLGFTSMIILWFAGLRLIVDEILLTGRFPLKVYNNVWYYHSFLWRQYALVVFLAGLGTLIAILKERKKNLFILVYVFIHLTMVVFFIPWLDSRYLLPIFPILFFAYLAYFLDFFGRLLFKKNLLVNIFTIGAVIFIVLNGHKFVFKPKLFYSPNADMREIPLVDYNYAYSIIKNTINSSTQPVAVLDTWGDRMVWYLGRDYKDAYWFRIMIPRTQKIIDGKKVDIVFHYGIVENVGDLNELLKRYQKIFVLVDGHEVPYIDKDVMSFVQNNFKLEKELSRFPLDPDPNDTWPAWLYSWGN